MNRFVTYLASAAIMFAVPACAQEKGDESQNLPAPIASESASAPEPVARSSPEDFEELLDQYLAYNQRLENIAFRILSRNKDSCQETQRSIGMKPHTVFDYPSDLQMMARVYLDIETQTSVRIVAKDSPAELAGLEPGDRILQLGEYKIPDGEMGGELFEAVSAREYQHGLTHMIIERQGAEKTVELRPISICGYPAQLFYSDVANAHTNGGEIWVTSELVRATASDISLALVFSHELAHAVQRHIFETPSRELELEADRLSLIYLDRAGYDAQEAIRLWKLNPLNHKAEPSESHPSSDERLKVLLGSLALIAQARQ
ncbi:MAG: M48 family metalloprotease [Hellea sp.]|nr:M48 family metalloprotease [Hellea sp.]